MVVLLDIFSSRAERWRSGSQVALVEHPNIALCECANDGMQNCIHGA